MAPREIDYHALVPERDEGVFCAALIQAIQLAKAV